MKNTHRLRAALLTFLPLSLAPMTATAHHGTSGQFDATKIVEVSGVITKMAFVNPHSYVYFDVVEPDGEVVNWNCELRASSVMRRSGWTKEMFATGTKIDIVGVASRRDSKGCYVETIAFNGSAPIQRYDQITEGMLEPVSERPDVTVWGEPNISGDWAAEQRLHGSIIRSNAVKVDFEELEELVANDELISDQDGRRRRNRGGRSYTAAGKAFVAEMQANSAEQAGRLDCQPRDFFLDWTFDQPANGIVQTEDKIILKYGFMDTVRTIHLNQNEFPEDIEPSWAGYSIGQWKGNVLTVLTRGFTAGGSERSGYRSEDYQTTEFFELDTKNKAIKRTYEAVDPTFWGKGETYRGQDIVYLSNVPWEPYNCDDRSLE